MSHEVLEKAEVQQLLNELFNFADNSFVQSGDRVQPFKLGQPAPKIGDVDRCAVYISLAPGMENPAGVDPPEDDIARCARYTSSEEKQNDPAPTTEERVAGKRPLTADPSPAEALPAESSQASKCRRLVWITDDDDEEEEAAPSLVRRPHSRPDVAPVTTGQVTSDPPAPHAEPTRVVEMGTASSDADPDHIAGQRAAEPVAAVGDVAPQSTEQPAATIVAESVEEHPVPTRNEESARTPSPSNVVEEESRAPTLPPTEERGVPTPPRAGPSSPVGSPGLG
ncbi:fibrous sheath CABYR-binding protein-like [Sorghum bicolor]|uniref:fibrous sheath CABYR-binding protein-like n=1 Tax=Sorghum bicolor TaxID=4558 RepID=UPI000B425FD4|nr:fibrous sheath CABYR-binding protein-like [Sorghum bicolor]|eukprot:XP_021307980.1 fibrous sheath CABYR-binding protein-like [Sorghum bicolor]